MCPRAKRTPSELNLKKILGMAFSKNVMPKESFFVASNVFPILYNKLRHLCVKVY